METPHFPVQLFGDLFENVYEPAEDSFLLLDALEKDFNLISSLKYGVLPNDPLEIHFLFFFASVLPFI